MLKKLLRGLLTLIGLVLGYILGEGLLETRYFNIMITKSGVIQTVLFLILCTLLLGLIFFLISPWIVKGITKAMEYFENNIQKVPISEIVFGTAGAMVGLFISAMFVSLFPRMSILWTFIEVIICLIIAAFGADIAIKKREEIVLFFSNAKKVSINKEKKNKAVLKSGAKVLDTSVIIDGRIFDICQTGFVEGTLIIPNFVLQELRHIADSSDGLKRNRGRRGLDILNKIQKELNVDVQIYEKDFPDIEEVDSKLLKLAQIMNGKVVTNDYNLNKVAEFQGVPVLNINELANAVKPVVLPGEEMIITIMKDGKESGQGIAYLDDGTMIVVEGGRKHIGETLNVAVTSVLQTAAGRMIFAKQKENLSKA
ncbi:PIN/TRAM domain-containing protein [Clostridium pasteurianum]|uniref:Integral membrane protein (PIN domain superfamily) n=1 Tax=Clostridium pasteurianum BC1 TaxID=86416 RepID=R4KC19_CLOPA|nr:PIN/TRAM domain-containing protein [Clostridium pasteurianum]AGK99246.1 integral membrane protein (PIN domain superfamily) [Clostridium pasteurianum BC1]